MTTTALNYLLSPRAAELRVRISAVFVFVSSVLIGAVLVGASPGLIVAGPWLALVLVWGAVTVAAYRRACARPAASISAPNAGQLAADARDGRRHAVEFGLPIDPWTQLEGFWCAAGDLPLTIDPVTGTGGDDEFAAEWRNAMLTPLRPERLTTVSDDEPFDLDVFVARTRAKLRNADTPEQRAAVEAYVDRRVAEYTAVRAPSGSLADLANRTGRTVEIVNGAGETLAVHPSVDRWESLTHQVRNVEQVRCTWALQGTAEDIHAIRALRAAGVKVTVINEYPMSKTRPSVAQLEGAQSAINQAHATYMQGLRERTATGKVTD